ncbi:single-stranded DNA-binding protein [Huintestinicola sp.]|jgi:single-strand DNA-binding protein|uniref:single-stranded DNA-binding protein n=1 Tax=Huintestinicola sp. TaxID=2981661 RepID=UPI00307C12BB
MINKWIGMGRLTADPELRQTQSGVSSCNVTVAVQRDFTDGSGERQSDFINVVAWRQTAEFICRYFSKGKMIGIEGALRTRNYDDKRYPDVKHYVTEVLVDHAYFGGDSGGSKSSSASPPPQHQASAATPAPADLSDFEEVASDSELPF